MRNKISINFSEMSQRLKFFYSTIFYWLNSNDNSESNEFELTKNENCLRAFLVSFIKISLIVKCFFKQKNLPKSSFAQGPESLRQYELKYENETILSKYFSSIEKEREEEFLTGMVDDLIRNESDHDYLSEIRLKLNVFSYSIVINNNLSIH